MENCIFCKIVAGEIPAKKVFETDKFLVFLTIEPQAKHHSLLIPKEHYRWFYDMPQELSDEMFRLAKELSLDLKKKAESDYVKLMLDGRDVPHVHVHLIPQKL